MKMIILPRKKFSYAYNGTEYDSIFFGNLLSSNADTDVIDEWYYANEYRYLDSVKISELNMKYTALKDMPAGHPATSSDWFGEGINSNRMIDNLFTSRSTFSDDAEITFEITGMTHLIGQGIDNVRNIKIRYQDSEGNVIYDGFDCDDCNVKSREINLVAYDSFDCDSCCNPPPQQRTSFFYKFDLPTCEKIAQVSLYFERYDTTRPMSIATLAVGRSFDIGCAVSGINIEMNLPKSTIEVRSLRQTGILPANIEVSIRGDVIVTKKRIDEIMEVMSRHGNYLNFYILEDDNDVKTGIVLGRFRRIGAPISSASRIIMPIDIYGILQ